MSATSLQDLYFQKLQTMLDAEQQIVQALPQLAQRVKSEQLRSALEKHLGETKQHVTRLERLGKTHGQASKPMECKSMRALIQEGQTMLANIQDPNTIDAFVIGAAQAVEHHEMAAYGTARAWARQLGFSDDMDTLQDTLDEEGNADKTLTSIAERSVNQQASQQRDREVSTGRAASSGSADREANLR